jgi:Tol biopolymer transport system component
VSRSLRLALSAFAFAFVSACGGAATAPPPAPVAGGDLKAALVYERVVGGNQDVYLTPAAGGHERRLTDHPAQDGLPRFTHDGKSVLFTSERSGNWQIWEVGPRGGEARRVRANAFTEWQVDESRDGSRLAFLSNLDGPECLFVMDRASGETKRLVRHGKNSILGNPHWSPDGRRIVFSSNWHIGHQIYLLDMESHQDGRLSPILGGGCEPRFSPDGRKVVYVSRGHHGDKSRLVEHDIESGKETVLVGWPALNYDPVYSPDGSELAFASNITGDWVLYRQRIADGRSWRVTFGPGPARNPDYRPAP